VLGWLLPAPPPRALIKNEAALGRPAPITLPQMDDFILWVTVASSRGGVLARLFYNCRSSSASPNLELGRAACRSMAVLGLRWRRYIVCLPEKPSSDPVARYITDRRSGPDRAVSSFLSSAAIVINSDCGPAGGLQRAWALYSPMAAPCRASPPALRGGLEGIICLAILAGLIRLAP